MASTTDDTGGDRGAYQLLLRAVDRETGGPESPDPAMVSESVLYGVLVTEGDLSHSRADEARRRAMHNRDLLQWPGPEGRYRYARVSDDALEAVIREQAERDHPDRGLIEVCNKLRRQCWADEEDDNE